MCTTTATSVQKATTLKNTTKGQELAENVNAKIVNISFHSAFLQKVIAQSGPTGCKSCIDQNRRISSTGKAFSMAIANALKPSAISP